VANYNNLIVLVFSDVRMFAKIVNISDGVAEIEYFNSVAQQVREQIPVDRITRFELQSQTRVFYHDGDSWSVGRVIDSLGRDDEPTLYSVQFPNKKKQDIPETELFVRCLEVFSDPAETLAAGCSETQLLADLRNQILVAAQRLRSASQGLAGPYSSAIELLPHQMATVRRVLQDSSIRYLLADEVGLGKTIEAGSIIRQMVLDHPEISIVVLVPALIVSQWEEELETRFYLDNASLDLEILPFERALDLESTPDLLVIDEAHRIVATGGDSESEVVRKIENLAHVSPSLLLLSATPALGDEQRLFRLLHLLDPMNYPVDDFEGFLRKVELRQQIGRLLLPLAPGGNKFVVSSQAKAAAKMFPGDDYVRRYSEEIVAADEHQEDRDRACMVLRNHIARSYRIHDRIIRSRRTDAEAWVLLPRAAPYPDVSHVRYTFDSQQADHDPSLALDAWRIAALEAQVPIEGIVLSRWRFLLETVSYLRPNLRDWIESAPPLFSDEHEYLEAIVEVVDDPVRREARYEAIFRDLIEWRRTLGTGSKIVCFLTDPDSAADLYRNLEEVFGHFDIAEVLTSEGVEARAERIARFEADPQAWLLVCGREAEEGVNLQFAHAIFHVDIPLSVERLEQRIGRLDRFGRRISGIHHRVLLPSDDEESPWNIWVALLLNGFQIFNGSVSDVQIQLEQLEAEVLNRLFREGGADAEEAAKAIRAEIDVERQKLDEQHIFDEITRLYDDGDNLTEAMEDAEEDEGALDSLFFEWMKIFFRIDRYPTRPGAQKYFRLFWGNPLLPKVPWMSVLGPSLDTPLTWWRSLSQRSEKVVRLVRPGADLFEAFERLTKWDDRGTAYATWRVHDSLAVETKIAFHWVWTLEPALISSGAVWEAPDRPDLARWAGSILSALVIEQWVDIDGRKISDENLLSIMKRPYRNCGPEEQPHLRDYNLGNRPEVLNDLIDPTLLAKVIKKLRTRCEEAIWNLEEVAQTIAVAKDRHERQLVELSTSLERRRSYFKKEFGRKFHGSESLVEDLEQIGRAIKNPTLRLEQCGLVVIAREAPDASGA
jgi:ATP-dependent helicase HepA